MFLNTTSFCGDDIFRNKIILLTKKTNKRATEVELLSLFHYKSKIFIFLP